MVNVLTDKVSIPQEQIHIVRLAAEAALLQEKAKGDLSVLIGTPEDIRALNRDFRSVDRITDVLTFPAWEGDMPLVADGYLGDIMICLERAHEQAEEYGHSIERELAFLTVHGVLHLLGFDHMTEEDEMIMRTRQTEILNRMGLGIL